MAERLFFSTLCSIPILLSSTPLLCSHVCSFLGTLQTRLLAHLLHTLKGESRLCMQYGKSIYFGGHKPTTKSFPASPEMWMAGGPWGMASCFGQNRSWGTFIRNHAAAISTPCQQHESCSFGQTPHPLLCNNRRLENRATSGGSAVKSHSSVKCAALWPGPGTSNAVRKGWVQAAVTTEAWKQAPFMHIQVALHRTLSML